MNDIAASEKRLGAALDRIDYGLDRLFDTVRRAAEQPVTAQTANVTGADNLTPPNLTAPDRNQVVALEQAQQRLAAAGAEAARLAAANDRLMEANRALIAAEDAPAQIDAVRNALEAEIEALQAARAAEVAQLGDILAALETVLGIPETAPLVPDAAPADVQAEFEQDAEAPPPEGRILRFGRDGEADSAEDDQPAGNDDDQDRG